MLRCIAFIGGRAPAAFGWRHVMTHRHLRLLDRGLRLRRATEGVLNAQHLQQPNHRNKGCEVALESQRQEETGEHEEQMWVPVLPGAASNDPGWNYGHQ